MRVNTDATLAGTRATILSAEGVLFNTSASERNTIALNRVADALSAVPVVPPTTTVPPAVTPPTVTPTSSDVEKNTIALKLVDSSLDAARTANHVSALASQNAASASNRAAVASSGAAEASYLAADASNASAVASGALYDAVSFNIGVTSHNSSTIAINSRNVVANSSTVTANSAVLTKTNVALGSNKDALVALTDAVNKNTESNITAGTVTSTVEGTQTVTLLSFIKAWMTGAEVPTEDFSDGYQSDYAPITAFDSTEEFNPANVETPMEWVKGHRDETSLIMDSLITEEDKGIFDGIKGYFTEKLDWIAEKLPFENDESKPKSPLKKPDVSVFEKGAGVEYIVGLGGHEGNYGVNGQFVEARGRCPFNFFTIRTPSIVGQEAQPPISMNLSTLCGVMTVTFNIGFAFAFIGIIIWGVRFIFN